MDGRELEHAQPLGERPASELVRARQRELLRFGQILFERERIAVRQFPQAIAHGEPPPRYRATTTNASSVVFRYRASILSAIRCGASLGLTMSAKAGSIPSVAISRVPRGSKGITSGGSAGSG